MINPIKQKQRYCFSCRKPLFFADAFLQNIYLDLSVLSNLWNDERVEFYCCSCYYREYMKYQHENDKNREFREFMERAPGERIISIDPGGENSWIVVDIENDLIYHSLTEIFSEFSNRLNDEKNEKRDKIPEDEMSK